MNRLLAHSMKMASLLMATSLIYAFPQTAVSASESAHLSITQTNMIPVEDGAMGQIVVTNHSPSATAYNVSLALPKAWDSVKQDASQCKTLAPGKTCTLGLRAKKPYLAEKVTLMGDNLIDAPTTAIAFTVHGYLVYAIDGSTVQVIAKHDVKEQRSAWSVGFYGIPGIYATSNPPPCLGAMDGLCNTKQIVAHYKTPYSSYAAGLCYQITSDHTGKVALGTWYLPAICQMGKGERCSSESSNIDALVQLGFGQLSGVYWSSTEFASNPTYVAWTQTFSADGKSMQSVGVKNNPVNIRCVRTLHTL